MLNVGELKGVVAVSIGELEGSRRWERVSKTARGTDCGMTGEWESMLGVNGRAWHGDWTISG